MTDAKQRSKPHLISMNAELMRRIEERGKMSAQTAGELTRQVMLCFLDGLVMPPRTVEQPPRTVEQPTRPLVAADPTRALDDHTAHLAARAEYDRAQPPLAPLAPQPTPPLRSVPPRVSAHVPPAAGELPDIDFDGPPSDALSAAELLLRGGR